MMLILITGITGMVGEPTARAALAAGHQVRGLGRSSQKLSKDVADHLESFVEVTDYYDMAGYEKAVKGADAIISASSATPEYVLDAQILLLRVAERAGVKIFHAASWNYDWTKLPLGFHEGYDTFISFRNHAQLTSKIKPIYTFTGTIPDYVFRRPMMNNPFDKDTLTFSFFGSGDEVDTLTTVDDIASYTIQAISEPNAAEGGLRYVSSFRTSMNELAAAYEDVRGVKLERKNLGTVDDVERALEEARAKTHPSNWISYCAYIYLKIQLQGRSAHENVDGARWMATKPTSLKEWLKAHPDI